MRHYRAYTTLHLGDRLELQNCGWKQAEFVDPQKKNKEQCMQRSQGKYIGTYLARPTYPLLFFGVEISRDVK